VLTKRTWALLISAALLSVVGTLNFIERLKEQGSFPATDGVYWAQTQKGITAETINPGSTADRAGIVKGDILRAISEDAIHYEELSNPSDIQIYLERAGVGGNLHYLVERPQLPEEIRYYYVDLYGLDRFNTLSRHDLYINFVGLIYLLVGLFVLFKQGGRVPFVLHFSTVCLAAFVFHFYKPVGEYQNLDLAVAFLDDFFHILFAPLFVHLCLLYPTNRGISRYWITCIYAPAILLIALTAVINFVTSPYLNSNIHLIDWLYRAEQLHFITALIIGAAFLTYRFVKSETVIVRQQLKWIVWGSIIAVLPLTLLYSVKYIAGSSLHTNSGITDLAILPLVLIPLTFGNSVVRYRLMDVDMVVRRAAAYALTTLTIATLLGTVVYFTGMYALGAELVHTGQDVFRTIIAVAAMAIIVIMAAPIKKFLQERIDRLFYGERYDLRNGLLDFGRTLSATTALDSLLNALVSRLQQVLGVERMVIFIEDSSHSSGYRIARAVGLSPTLTVPPDFREMIESGSIETGIVRADDIDQAIDNDGRVRRSIHYYVPCTVRGRIVAVIGLGRSADGALLSSEDLEILRTVSGYIAVAIENSLLYQEQERRAAELALLKEFNESIIESINIGLVAVDANGRITGCNSALEEMFGVQRETVLGERVEELFAEDFSETLRQVLGAVGWNLTSVRHLYKIHTATRNSRSLVLNIALAPLRTDSMEHTGALVVLEDVTARTGLEEQLQQREKLSSIGLLAAGVAHEINTPITGVSSYTQMLLGMIPEGDPKHALLQKVRRQAERASDIVNNLLNFSRTGNASEFGEVDINRVLDDTLQLLEPQMRRSQIEMVRLYDPDLPKAFGNAGKLQQIFTNLLLNARDAIPDGGRITLSTSYEEGRINISVADTGIGIASENLSKIFDPFYTTKGVGRGTGLGLAVSYGIVKEHAGHITVDSTPGRGTTFHIQIPTIDSRVRLQAASD
jgi:two-component system, NtrC family, sensor kinase